MTTTPQSGRATAAKVSPKGRPTMPTAAPCPRWCLEDHELAWEQSAGQPALVHRSRVVVAETLAGRVVVDVARADREPTCLHLHGDGRLDAAGARQFAAALLDAADELDKVTR